MTSLSPEEIIRTRQQEAAGTYEERKIAMYLARLETAEQIIAAVPAACERLSQLAAPYEGGVLRIVHDGEDIHEAQACWRVGPFQDRDRHPLFVITSRQKIAQVHHFNAHSDSPLDLATVDKIRKVALKQAPHPSIFYSTVTADQLAMWQLGTSWQKMHAELRDLLAAMRSLAVPVP